VTLAGITAFMRDARTLLKALDVPVAAQIKTFLNAINGQLGVAIRQSAELHPPATLEEAFEIASRRAADLDDVAASGFAGICALTNQKHPAKQPERQPARQPADQLVRQPPRTERPQQSAQSGPEQQQQQAVEVRCAYCHKSGHMKAECRALARKSSQAPPPRPPEVHRDRRASSMHVSATADPPSSSPKQAPSPAVTASRPKRSVHLPAYLEDYDLAGTPAMIVTTEGTDPALDFPELCPLSAPPTQHPDGGPAPVPCIPARLGVTVQQQQRCPTKTWSPSRSDDRPRIVLAPDRPGNPPLHCVLDTGASVSLMSEALAAQLGCTPTAHVPVSVIFGNGAQATLTRAVTLSLQLTPQAPRRPVTFMVAENTPPGPYALLGRPDLAGFTISFKDATPSLCWAGLSTIEEVSDPIDWAGEPLPVQLAEDGTPEIAIGDKLSPEEVLVVKQILCEYADCFGGLERQPADLPLFSILLKDGATPAAAKPRRLNSDKMKIVDEEIDRLLALGIIKRSNSPWAAPLVVAVNRTSGKARVCYDFRALNAQTVRDAYPIPATADVLQWFAGKPYLASFDMSKGYLQTPVAPQSQPLLAFTCHRGLFEPNRVLFGPTNAPQFFHRAIVQKLACIPEARSFIDDISIATATFPAFCDALRRFFDLCRKTRLRLNGPKCVIGPSRLPSLGRLVGPDSVEIDPSRLAPIRTAAPPRNKEVLASFLGLAQWFAMFVPGLAGMSAVLWNLAKPVTPFVWREEHQQAFSNIIRAILEAEPLAQPFPGRQLILRTDASDIGVGGVLLQHELDGLRPLSFFSRLLTPAETNYNTLEKEALAILYCLDRGRSLIHGPVVVVTDHSNLRYLRTLANQRVQRWLVALSEFDITVAYAPGKTNVIADFLSRAFPDTPTSIPDPQSTDLARGVPVCPVELDAAKPSPLGSGSDGDLENFVKSLSHDVVDGKIVLKDPPSPELRTRIWALAHDTPFSGHVGRRRTLYTIKQVIDWPGIDRDINQLSADCALCQKLHAVPGHADHLGSTAASAPFASVFVDHLGPLRPSGDPPFRHIPMIIDRFSHYLVAVPVPDLKATTTAQALVEEWVCRFGIPAMITSDRGPSFNNEVVKRLVHLLSIKHHLSAPHHPEGHASVERANRSIMQVLRALFRKSATWHNLVKLAAFALNTSYSRVLGTTPFEVTHGFAPRLPIHAALGGSPGSAGPDEPGEFAASLVSKVVQIHARATALQAALHKEQDAEYRKKAKGRTKYNPGEHVLLRIPRPDKLLLEWRGPYQVIGAVPDTQELVYELEDIVNHEHTQAHVNRLHIFRAGALSSAEVLTEACAQEEYLVDEVLTHAYRNNELWLAVNWKGYPRLTPEDDDAWVAYSDARFAPPVRAYVAKHHLKPRRCQP